jgi:hypothetical protein
VAYRSFVYRLKADGARVVALGGSSLRAVGRGRARGATGRAEETPLDGKQDLIWLDDSMFVLFLCSSEGFDQNTFFRLYKERDYFTYLGMLLDKHMLRPML